MPVSKVCLITRLIVWAPFFDVLDCKASVDQGIEVRANRPMLFDNAVGKPVRGAVSHPGATLSVHRFGRTRASMER